MLGQLGAKLSDRGEANLHLLDEERAHEQIADFSTARGPNGERATFWLCVTAGWTDIAWKSVKEHGERHDRVDVLTVTPPSG